MIIIPPPVSHSTCLTKLTHGTSFVSKQILLNRVGCHELKGAIRTKLSKPLAGSIEIKTIQPRHEDSAQQYLAEDEAEVPESSGVHHPPAEVQVMNALKEASKWLSMKPIHNFRTRKDRPFTTSLLSRSAFNRFSIRTYAAVFIKDESGDDTPKSPDFSSIRRDCGESTITEPGKEDSFASDPRLFTYMVVGASGVFTAMAARAAIIDFLAPLSPSAATQASSQTELDLSAIPEGKNTVVSWRGKPVFVRHRSLQEIEEMASVDISTLRDPQRDSDRAQKPEWLVMLGICTHLGCVPIGDSGDYNGWYCPCHGSHYDLSGRIRKGPAPFNLEVPKYKFTSETNILIG